MSEQADRDALVEVLAEHILRHSWNGFGGHSPAECGCGKVLSTGTFSAWEMEGAAHRAHLADVLAQRDRWVAAEALRRFADSRGVNVGDEDDDYWRGYRQAQRECLHDAARVADRIGSGE